MTEIDGIKLQLAQVNLLLEIDSNNSEYIQLRSDLEELLSLTQSGMEYYFITFSFLLQYIVAIKISLTFISQLILCSTNWMQISFLLYGILPKLRNMH